MNTRKSIISILLGGLVLFIWHAISWTTLPFHGDSLTNLPDNIMDQVASALPGVKSGVYHYPGLPDEASSITNIENKLQTKPRVTLMVVKAPPSQLIDLFQYLKSLGINLATSGLLFLVLRSLTVSSPKEILKASILIGLIIGLTADMAQMNWFLFPWSYTLLSIIDHLVGFTLLGLLFGKMMAEKKYQNAP